MRIRIKDESINLNNIRIEKKGQEYSDKIAVAEKEFKQLQLELEEASKGLPVRDLKPMLAQKFLKDAFHKLKHQVDFEKQTAKACKSVIDIKSHAVKTTGK